MAKTGVEAENPGDAEKLNVWAQIKNEILKIPDVLGNLKTATQELVEGGENLNKAFIQSRQRMDEFLVRIQNATPAMKALGAETKDVANTIAGIAAGARRVVVASSEDLREVYSVSQVLGVETAKIVEAFGAVGYNYQQISSNVLNSIVQVQSYGLNAKTVMGDVLKNMDQMSRFNFSNGVQGLTKMAAQASMLRFDMNQTFQLAEKVLDPDQAVSVASAFQRLGVAAGNLVDPMALLNQSLTDPSGLQDSLINVARQFTYFDEQTKSFKINPQGILTLREMEAQTGVSAKAMREAALAAADLDKRLALINQTGLALDMSENDKTLLANISRIGDKGTMEVKVSRPGEAEAYKNIADVTKEEMSRIVEEQKKAPKTMEDLQRAQLTTGEKTLAEFKKLNATVAGNVLGAPGYMGFLENTTTNIRKQMEEITQDITGGQMKVAFQSLYDKASSGDETQKREAYKDIMELMKSSIMTPLKNMGVVLGDVTEGFGEEFLKEIVSAIPGIETQGGKGEKVTGIKVPKKTETAPKAIPSPTVYGPSSAMNPMVMNTMSPLQLTHNIRGVIDLYDRDKNKTTQVNLNELIDMLTTQQKEMLLKKLGLAPAKKP